MFLVECLGGNNWIQSCQSIACLPTGLASITSFIYNAIRVVTPLILVIIGMIDMAKAIMAGKEDEIKKSQQLLVKRAVAAAIVFLLFSLVTWFLDILSSNGTETQSVVKCLNVLFGQEKTTKISDDEMCRLNGYDGEIKIYGNYDYSLSTLEEYSAHNYYSACYKVSNNPNCNGLYYTLNDGKSHCIITQNDANYTIGDAYKPECDVNNYGASNIPGDFISLPVPKLSGNINVEGECNFCCNSNGYSKSFLANSQECLCLK